MTLKLHLAHQTRERTRLRAVGAVDVPRDARNAAIAALATQLEDKLTEAGGLVLTEARPATGSLIVEHPGVAGDTVLAALAGLPCELVEPPSASARTGLSLVDEQLERIDRGLRDASTGSADLRSLAFLLLTGLAITQLVRGQVAAPAASLLWYAFDLTRHRGEGGRAAD